jgi:hypothetical protein
VLPIAAAALAVVGVLLIVTDDDSTPDTTGTPKDGAATLGIEDSSQASVEDLSGLDFPDSATEFLSAQLDDGSQLDVTAIIPSSEEAAFLEASGLPIPVAGERVVTHSSPLWDLNPSGTIRGVTDTTATVQRAVELVDEEGSTRVRAVITPAG